MYGLSAAHKTMKFGTKLRVTNPDTGKSVVVIVNDRGPFIRGRDLDLSYGAAREIGLVEKGVGRVRVEFLERDMRYVRRIPFVQPGAPASYTIQVGSFTQRANALRLKKGLAYTYEDVSLTSVMIKRKKHYRVRIGEFSSYDDAYSMAEKLADEGYRTLIVKAE